MVKDNQELNPTSDAARRTHAPVANTGRDVALRLLILSLTGVLIAGLVGLLMGYRWLRPTPSSSLFPNWPKPDFALVLSAQQHGYLLPCGCSSPQKGGLERRYNLIQSLKERGWPVVAADVGDIPQRSGPVHLPNVQGLIKYRYSMEALQRMGYTAVGVGEYEMGLPLFNAIGEYALDKSSPRMLAANLTHKDIPEGILGSWEVADVKDAKLKVGFVGAVGTSVGEAVRDENAAFARNDKVLPAILKEMDAKAAPDFRVLLYQGSLKEAKVLAQALPQFQVILYPTGKSEEEPPAVPEKVGNTWLIGVGHKGKHVGVVGVYRTGKADKPFDLRYELVTLSEDYLTPDDKRDDHPVVKLMEEYAKELKRDDYLTMRYIPARHLHQVGMSEETMPKYVGSDKCKQCHKDAYKVWENSAHSHAYQALVDARRPSLRQFDGECVVCHVVGFGFKSGFENAEKTPHLKNVGCESCHGPASLHVKNPGVDKWKELMNPWKAKANEDEPARKKRLLAVNQSCQTCHDFDNDVHWNFEKKWPKVAHPTPGN